jgi:hypothetical protein
MRIKESYTLFKRTVPSGGVVFYYRTYNENGKRTCGHSTGETTKSAAREYCNGFLRVMPGYAVKKGILQMNPCLSTANERPKSD